MVREYGGTSAVFSFNGAWILLVTGGGPTPNKPGVAFAPPTDPNLIAHAMTIRVPDCRGAYDALVGRGATFLTPPIDNGPEIRCFFRDPDGHLFEISEFRAAWTSAPFAAASVPLRGGRRAARSRSPDFRSRPMRQKRAQCVHSSPAMLFCGSTEFARGLYLN